MSTAVSEVAPANVALGPVLPSAPVRQRIFIYLSVLIFLFSFGSPAGGLIDIPVSFILKNRLHLEAHEVAHFRLIAAVPLYFSFIFGLVRDLWSPLRRGDRGYMLVFGTATAIIYVGHAFAPFSYGTLLIGITLLTASCLFVASAENGLASTLGQQHLMSGQISAAWNIAASVPTIAALLIGGALSDLLEGLTAERTVQILFLTGAAIMASIAVFALWKPHAVFAHLESRRIGQARPLHELKRMLMHWPLYPVLFIWLLWNFAPGSATPLQYHLQNTLHASDAVWGEWNAIFALSFIPTFFAFGVLCRKFALKTLLWWGTIVAIPQLTPLLFISSAPAALIAAVPIGLMGGVATAGYLDLIIRACPKGLQGTTMMMSGGLVVIASRFGDVLGTHLYDYYGSFSACVIATTAVYALIIPALLCVPRRLVVTRDGQALT